MKKILLSIPLIFSLCNAIAQYDYITTIKTPTNVTVEAIYRVEYSANDLALAEEHAANWINNYDSKAQRVAPASRTYNCHDYAWHHSDGGNKVWVNQFDQYGSANVSKYWSATSPTYQLTTSSNASKAFYPTYPEGDHSAKVISSSVFESKWGAWPKYRHSPTDCPYDASNLKYYCVPVSGDGVVCASKTYSTLNIPNATYSWSGEKVSINEDDYSVTATKTNNGSGWIQTQISSPYSGTTISSEKHSIWVGAPDHLYLYQTFADNYSAACAGETVGIKVVGSSELMNDNISMFSWDMDAWQPYFTTHGFTANTNKSHAWFSLPSNSQGSYNVIHVTATNACGDSYPVSMGYYVSYCGGGWYMMAYPNPANEYAELNFYTSDELSEYQKESKTMVSVPGNEITQEIGEYKVQIWHERKGLLKQMKSNSKKLQIPTNDLEQGIYILRIIVNGKVHSQKLKIQR